MSVPIPPRHSDPLPNCRGSQPERCNSEKVRGVFVPEHLNVRPVLAVSLTADVELLPDGLT